MVYLSRYKQSIEKQRWELNPEPLTLWAVSSEILCGEENDNFIKIQLLPVNSDILKKVTALKKPVCFSDIIFLMSELLGFFSQFSLLFDIVTVFSS